MKIIHKEQEMLSCFCVNEVKITFECHLLDISVTSGVSVNIELVVVVSSVYLHVPTLKDFLISFCYVFVTFCMQ